MTKIRIQIIRRTAKAVLVRVDESVSEWIPLSQVNHISTPPEKDAASTIELESWLVNAKGLGAFELPD